ncbi:P-loop NTPase family protein [Micromonospora rifamycinica]|uniref:Dynamin family protein n=1 Tax=Micromonospora rifamycinica TaxID=291594 RepID=A0A109IQ44_9ACTN|nr:hypothetical protein [Micromonospora rifamycinica]KWV34648.1 hypothetical protein AWV63_00290 [Micromonospora rifamycinica]SCG67404.1 Dynamin family protein [Micromonospora rifamycinica]
MSESTQALIERYQRWAERVRADAQAATVPGELIETQRELIGYAFELENAARAPITVGVVGEFSTGKSLLLGALLGNPELLPAASNATTGNVTALRLSAGPPGSAVAVTGASVSLLSGTQIEASAGFILAKIASVVAETRLPVDVAPLRDYNPVRDGWHVFEQWCRRFIWPDVENPELHEAAVLGIRDSAWELLRIRNALDRAGALVDPVNPGVSRPVSLGEYAAALAIDDLRTLPTRFPVRPPTVPLAAGSELTSGVLRELFPLVGRVNLQISVPAGQWPVHELAGLWEVEFLDFPGLNARGAARDDFLSASMLRPVHTILIVVRAERPDTEVPTRFLALLAGHGRGRDELADAAIVVNNMFDLLPPPAAPARPTTVAQLAAGHVGLRAVLDTGRDLTGGHPDRVAMTSLLYAIDVHRMPLRPGGALAATLSTHRPVVGSRMSGWRAAADAVTPREPAEPLSDALVAVGEDGGVRALRAMISKHVSEHGVRLKLEALRRHTDALHHLTTRLAWHDHDGARATADGVVADLLQLSKDLGEAERTIKNRVGWLRPGTGDPTWQRHLDEALEELRVEVAAIVYRWSGWDETFAAARTGRVVPPVRSARPRPPAAPGGGRVHTERRPHTDHDRPQPGPSGSPLLLGTEELHTPFGDFVRDASRVAGRLFGRLADRWVREVSERLEVIWAQSPDPLAEPGRSAALAALDPDGGANRRSWLDSLAHLRWVTELTGRQREVLADPPELEWPAARQLFPLLPAQRMPWAPAAATDPSGRPTSPPDAFGNDQGGDVIRLMRMRQELTDGVLQLARQRLSHELTQLADAIETEIFEVHQEIPRTATIDRLDTDRAEGTTPGGSRRSSGSTWHQLLQDWPDELRPSNRRDER